MPHRIHFLSSSISGLIQGLLLVTIALVNGAQYVAAVITGPHGFLFGAIVVPSCNATTFSTWSREQHPMRMARGAALAKANNWGYLDVWTAFNDDGRDLTALIPDGTHGSVTASSEIFAPALINAFDAE